MVVANLREQTQRQIEQYARQYRDSRRQLNGLTAAGTDQIARLLRELSADIGGRLATFASPSDPFVDRLLPAIASDIQSSIDVLVRGASAEMGTALTSAFTIGGRVTANALNSVGLGVAFPSITPELLVSASAATGGIFADFGTRLSDDILATIRRSTIAIRPSSMAIRDVIDLLKTGGAGERINFAAQGEAIVRTELGGIYSNAQQAAAEQIANTIPGLRKRWITTLKKRRGHREAEAAYAPGGSIGPILINQRFRVTDYSRTGPAEFLTRSTAGGGKKVAKVATYQRRGRLIVDKMLFPLDPSASAGNRVNCTCLTIEVVPGLEEEQARAVELVQEG
jgi:hypothetical protein